MHLVPAFIAIEKNSRMNSKTVGACPNYDVPRIDMRVLVCDWL